jgi:hypothetical protein
MHQLWHADPTSSLSRTGSASRLSGLGIFAVLHWDHTLPGPDADKYGAFHTSEVPYVFNSLAKSDRPFADADHRIAEMLFSYWTNLRQRAISSKLRPAQRS